jgi:hypothetical protein
LLRRQTEIRDVCIGEQQRLFAAEADLSAAAAAAAAAAADDANGFIPVDNGATRQRFDAARQHGGVSVTGFDYDAAGARLKSLLQQVRSATVAM